MEDEEILQIHKMTVEEVKENPPKIDRKFVLINSSLYTDEAFEYILELINQTDSVLFIRDTRKIYTQGEYFGGDIWENNLFYFSTFQLLNDSEEEIAQIKSEVDNETLRIQGLNNITLSFEEYYVHGDKVKTFKIGYDIANSIDNSIVTIDDPTAQYNLEIKDEKIAINKYIPIRVEIPESSGLIEFDNTPETITFDLNIYGTSENKIILASGENDNLIGFNEDYTEATANIIPNVTNNYLILYSDEQVQGSVIYTQKFGYAVCWGTDEIKANNFNTFERYLTETSCNCEFFIDQSNDKFGWFACPSTCKPVFIDQNSGLRGGWIQYDKITVYSLNMEYTVWRTEHSGLGDNKWVVEEYKK